MESYLVISKLKARDKRLEIKNLRQNSTKIKSNEKLRQKVEENHKKICLYRNSILWLKN